MKLSEKIYQLRTDHELTQAQFGAIAGVSDKAVSTWEIGVKEPRMKSVQKICAYFQIDVNQFIDPASSLYEHKKPVPNFEDGLSDTALQVALAYDRAHPGVQLSIRKLLDLSVQEQGQPWRVAARGGDVISDAPNHTLNPEIADQLTKKTETSHDF